MTRKRLRPALTPEQLARTYAVPYDHRQWQDHELRVAQTITFGRWVVRLLGDRVRSGADLSAGDGTVLMGLPLERKVFGDLTGQWEITGFGDRTGPWEITGQLEHTLPALEPVDLYVCTETLEHLDDPDLMLKTMRAKCRALLLSTPVDAWEDPNPEHYWAWSRADVEVMLRMAGFRPFVYSSVDFRELGPQYYEFGIWACE